MKDSPVDSVATPKVAIDWYRATPWWPLASQSIVISWRATHILLCAGALFLTQVWMTICREMFGPEPFLPFFRDWIAPQSNPEGVPFGLGAQGTDSPLVVWQKFLFPTFEWLSNPTLKGTAFYFSYMIGVVAIWSFVGGCLTRRSVIELGTKMTATWLECFRMILKRWQSIAWSVTMPSGLIVMIAVFPLLLGWLSNIPAIGPWLAGLLMIPVVFLCIGIGWCAAITLFGFPLSVCAIVTEKGADAYDGISRSAAYTFQRPLTLVLCVLAAEFLSKVGGTLLSIVLTTGFRVVEAAFDIGSFTSLRDFESMWGPILRGIVPLLLAAYGLSYFWTASAATYLILRKDVDHAEFDLVDMEIEERKGLPKLPQADLPKGGASAPASDAQGSDAPSSALPENTAE
jgi:hypothetical protein